VPNRIGTSNTSNPSYFVCICEFKIYKSEYDPKVNCFWYFKYKIIIYCSQLPLDKVYLGAKCTEYLESIQIPMQPGRKKEDVDKELDALKDSFRVKCLNFSEPPRRCDHGCQSAEFLKKWRSLTRPYSCQAMFVSKKEGWPIFTNRWPNLRYRVHILFS